MRGLQGVYPARFTNRRSVFRNRKKKGEIIRHSVEMGILPEDVGDQYPVFWSKQKPMPISLQSVGQFNLVSIPRDTKRKKKI